MEMGAKLDETVNGLNYQDRSFMIAGYLSDYKPVDILGEVLDKGEDERPNTYADFKENRGYVDKTGHIWIYRATPNEKEGIPWFTITYPDGEIPKLKFNPNRANYDEEAFHINHVGDLSIKEIINNTTDKPVEYDPEVVASVVRATALVHPEIKDEDDFLKKLVKQTILSKHVNVRKYATKVPKTWILHNLIQSTIYSDTKCSTKPFLEWMELLDCDFTITIKDNGKDKDDPLRKEIVYDSSTDKLLIDGEEIQNDWVETSQVEGPDEEEPD